MRGEERREEGRKRGREKGRGAEWIVEERRGVRKAIKTYQER